uniref:Uncharacterized protein n=1 Tax=Anguilla anguilla TaxID=7936 RepID=A0A0E9T2K1_ANGAN
MSLGLYPPLPTSSPWHTLSRMAGMTSACTGKKCLIPLVSSFFRSLGQIPGMSTTGTKFLFISFWTTSG